MRNDREQLERDVERLERYLQWRERTDRAEREARAARRRWWLPRAGVMLALMMVVVGLLMWLAQNRETTRHAALAPSATELPETARASRDPAPARSEGPPAPDVHSAAAPAVESSPAPQSPASQSDRGARARSARRATAPDGAGVAPPGQSPAEPPAVGRRAPTTPMRESHAESAESGAARESAAPTAVVVAPRASEPPGAFSERAETPEVADVPTTQAPPVSGAAAPSGPGTAAVSASSPNDRPVAVVPDIAAPSAAPEHRSAEAAKPSCADLGDALRRDSSVDGRSRTQRIVGCVGGWLKGESRELREGFKREIEEFRSGVDNVGRGLQWLGDKLRR